MKPQLAAMVLALVLTSPNSAKAQWVSVPTPQFSDPYAPLRQLQQSQATQAAQEQARAAQMQAEALRQQAYLQQQQLELQRQQLQLEIARQQREIEAERQQLAQMRQRQNDPLVEQQSYNPQPARTDATKTMSSPKARVVPKGVYLKSATLMEDGAIKCEFTNGLIRYANSETDCWNE